MKLFDKNFTCNISVEKNVPKSVILAANDLRDNLLDLSGKTEGFCVYSENGGQIVIKTDSSISENYAEGYTVQVNNDGVFITGFDELGTIYGIYAFATKCLGIDPMYHFTDVFPSVREEMVIENTLITSKVKETRFRGWFINDEDFLSGYKNCGASQRRIYYNMEEMFKPIIAPEMIDIICQTALRMEMNMIIPYSYLDILNPVEEETVKVVTDRGMYISMHHQEPVGVGHFEAFNYFEEHYTGKDVSYARYPEEMKSVWRTYIKEWAKYGDKVIWQLGLRGEGDKAVWATDASISDAREAKGKLISDAINTQYNLIKEALGGKNFVSTMTLWMEAAKLYDEGFLEINDDTILVFADVGLMQLMSGDFYQIERKEGCKYGIYYHAALYIEGPHYTDGTDPHKMIYVYRDAKAYNTNYYSVLNVGNLRDVCPSVRLSSEIVNSDWGNFDITEYYKNTYPQIFGEVWQEVSVLDEEYFASIGDLGMDMIKQFLSDSDFYYYEKDGIPGPYFPLTDGTILRLGTTYAGSWRNPPSRVFTHNAKNVEFIQKTFLDCIEKYTALLPRITALQDKIPNESLAYYRFSRVYRTRLMLNITKWAYYTSQMWLGHDVDLNRAKAETTLCNVLSFRTEYAQGKWADWYKHDTRHNIADRLALTKTWWLDPKPIKPDEWEG